MSDIKNDIELLAEPFKTKVKVFLAIVKKKYNTLAPFETLRTKDRQKRLVDNGKSWTMKSYHLKGKAVDWIFLDGFGNPTRKWDYKYLHYVGFMCGMTPIYNNGKLVESCHLQDDLKSIKVAMKSNSDRRKKSTQAREKKLLNQVNEAFREYGYN